MIEDVEEFYQELTARVDNKLSLAPAAKTIILFRVAIETGAKELGLPKVVNYLRCPGLAPVQSRTMNAAKS